MSQATEKLNEELISVQRKLIAEMDRRIELLEGKNAELLLLTPKEKRPLSPEQELVLEVFSEVTDGWDLLAERRQ